VKTFYSYVWHGYDGAKRTCDLWVKDDTAAADQRRRANHIGRFNFATKTRLYNRILDYGRGEHITSVRICSVSDAQKADVDGPSWLDFYTIITLTKRILREYKANKTCPSS
jgi:hypothetical protein